MKLKVDTWAKLAMGACAVAALTATHAMAQRGPQTDEQQLAQAKEWNATPAPSDPRDFQGVWWTRGTPCG